MSESKLCKSQKRQYAATYKEDDRRYKIVAEVRYDDQCGNGHNTFALTGTIYEAVDGRWRDYSGGCIHEDIAKRFPDLARYIKWHLCTSEEPWGYVGNTVWYAGDRDTWHLRKGEKLHLRHGKTGVPCWDMVMRDENGDTCGLLTFVTSPEKPTSKFTVSWEPHYVIGEGKERELDAARRAAVWPEATDEQLMLEPEELKKLLTARLPALMAEFRKDMESLGFVW